MTPNTPEELATMVTTLKAHAQEWADLSIHEKIKMGKRLMQGNYEVAGEQVAVAAAAKKIPADSHLVGEEWLGGPMITLRTLRFTLRTLEAFANNDLKGLLSSDRVSERPDGQVVVKVFPFETFDGLMFKDFEAHVWMMPEVKTSDLYDTMATFYRQSDPVGKVALVLGAGNQASIGPLDVIYKLFVEGQVCILKMNPVNEYLGPFVERAFAEFIDRGFLQVCYGGAEVGKYLCEHPDVDEIHITGSDKTHDAIVYGTGKEGQRRKASDDRVVEKRVTSELGNVSPLIVVPGQWSEADLKFQAENIATQLANNGAFNCNATRVLITHKSWPQRQAFLDALGAAYSRIPQRAPYYPGARERYETWLEGNKDHTQTFGAHNDQVLPWALVSGLDPVKDADNLCLTEESFCSIQAETPLDAPDVPSFLRQAVDFANDKLWGTLSAALIASDDSQKQYGTQIDQAIADLRYGSVVLNHWPAISYGLGVTTWGAYPGHTYQDIQSGIGVVHNAFMFEHPQKSVIRGPFRVFPKPPWFVTHKKMEQVAQRLVDFEYNPGVKNLARVTLQAIRG